MTIVGIDQIRRAKQTREMMQGILEILDGADLIGAMSALSMATNVVFNVLEIVDEDREALLETLCEVVMSGQQRGLDS